VQQLPPKPHQSLKIRHTKTMKKQITLFDRVGGEQGVKDLVRSFYDRVLKDSELVPFFEGASIERLFAMQYDFFAAALDGPVKYSGLSIYRAHAGRGIKGEHFARFVNHLIDTLKAWQFSERENMYADDVTGAPVVPGPS
jgi:hemoglobin